MGTNPYDNANDLAAYEATAEGVLSEPRALTEAPETGRRMSDVARDCTQRIERHREYLPDVSYRITSIGQIGVGKSSLIAVLGGLLVGDQPRGSFIRAEPTRRQSRFHVREAERAGSNQQPTMLQEGTKST
jgi:hypothetical protein